MTRNEKRADDIHVNRGKLGEISVVEITLDELDQLQQGSPSSALFNFAVFFIGIGISFFISIFSTKIEDIRVYNVFWIIAILAMGGGIVCLVLWSIANRKSSKLIQRIKDRMPKATTDDSSGINESSG